MRFQQMAATIKNQTEVQETNKENGKRHKKIYRFSKCQVLTKICLGNVVLLLRVGVSKLYTLDMELSIYKERERFVHDLYHTSLQVFIMLTNV